MNLFIFVFEILRLLYISEYVTYCSLNYYKNDSFQLKFTFTRPRWKQTTTGKLPANLYFSYESNA